MADIKSEREIRFQQFREQIERIELYLTTQSQKPGITKMEQKNVRNHFKTHVIQDGRVYYVGAGKCKQEVVTDSSRMMTLITQYHDQPMGGHSGRNATLAKLSSGFYWPGMTQDINNFIKACDRCQRNEVIKTQAPVLQSIKVKEPLELVGMDLIGPLPITSQGHRYVLTMTDYFTKFVDFFPLKSKEASGVCNAIKKFICRY